MFSLEWAGIKSFDVKTRTGAYAGLIALSNSGDFWRVYFDSNCTKGSQRKFSSVEDAISYIEARRIKKGWKI